MSDRPQRIRGGTLRGFPVHPNYLQRLTHLFRKLSVTESPEQRSNLAAECHAIINLAANGFKHEADDQV